MSRTLTPAPDAVLAGRIQLVAGLILLVFGAFLLRLFQLQVLEGEVLSERSAKNSIRTVLLEAPRGEIVDREGRVLATTRPAFGVSVLPNELHDPERTLPALAQLLEREVEAIEGRLGRPRGSARFKPVAVATDLSFDELARVESHGHALAGVATDVQPRRHYVEGKLAAHLLGTIGEVRSEQLERDAFRDYRAGDIVGQTGLEAKLEAHLQGRPGGRNVVVDVSGREVEVIDEVPAVPGGRAVLTLDLDLQRAMEDAFDEVPEGAAPKIGAAVALEVATGDVLAMTSRPGFDPNDFAGGIDAETWNALTGDPWKPLQNRAIQNHYPPGSTYKAVMAAAMLEAGVITEASTVFCPGYYRFGRRSYRCWKRGGHGTVNLRTALQRSCDVFFYHYGVKLGIERIAEFAGEIGLGRPTGVALTPEVTGLVPNDAWKRKRFGEPWYPGETVSASIGQGYNLMTPIQLAVTYAAIANGGRVMRPRLIARLETREGELVLEEPIEIRAELDIPPPYLDAVRRGLEAVVEETGGTGGRARVPGVRVAGKTGTTQVVRLEQTEGLDDDEIPFKYRDHAWFAAFAPAEAPEIVVAVFVEHGQHGSSAAAPIAQRVLARYFEKKGVVQTARGGAR